MDNKVHRSENDPGGRVCRSGSFAGRGLHKLYFSFLRKEVALIRRERRAGSGLTRGAAFMQQEGRNRVAEPGFSGLVLCGWSVSIFDKHGFSLPRTL